LNLLQRKKQGLYYSVGTAYQKEKRFSCMAGLQKRQTYKRRLVSGIIVLILSLSLALSGCRIMEAVDLDNGTVDIDMLLGQDDRGYIFRDWNVEYVKENIERGVVDVNSRLFFTGKLKKVSPLYLVQFDFRTRTGELMVSEYLLENGADQDARRQ
jgi:hypothetical protein